MFIEIVEPDGTIVDSLEIRKGRPVLSLEDARRHDRRNAYYQQRHVQRALRDETVKRRKKTEKLTKVDDGLKYVEIETDEEGNPYPNLCGRYPLPMSTGASIRRSGDNDNNHCHVAGLMKCGSVWACPVCGRKILRGRAEEIRKAVEHFEGKAKYMVTLTARHDRDTDLATFAKTFREARRHLAQKKRFVKFRQASAGYITAAEITWSTRNGWHWHVHELWFDCPKPDFAEEWTASLERKGLSCVAEYGYDVSETFSAAEYIAKAGIKDADENFRRTWDAGNEIAGVRKGSGIWDLAATRYDLVREHFHGTRGMRRISWSKGLKALVNVDEVSENEMNGDAMGEEVIHIPAMMWRQIHAHGLIPDVLECAEMGGSHLVVETLIELQEANWNPQTIKQNREIRARLGVID